MAISSHSASWPYLFGLLFDVFFFSLNNQVAPLAMTDASMLAPEEVYKSAGLVKGESELTPEERKRRRAQKKRKRKGPLRPMPSIIFKGKIPLALFSQLFVCKGTDIIMCLIALAGAKTAEENLKKIRMSNAPVKDPLQELNVRSRPMKDTRTTSSFSKSAKVCKISFYTLNFLSNITLQYLQRRFATVFTCD